MTTFFLYDGGTPVAEETYGGGVAAFRDLNGWGADGWRSRYTGNQVFNYTFDASGDLAQRQLVGDTDALAQDSAAYAAYGSLLGDLDTSANPYVRRDPVGFGGQWGNYTDVETGLLCLTHRDYDPATGRFVSRDPIDYTPSPCHRRRQPPHHSFTSRVRLPSPAPQWRTWKAGRPGGLQGRDRALAPEGEEDPPPTRQTLRELSYCRQGHWRIRSMIHVHVCHNPAHRPRHARGPRRLR